WSWSLAGLALLGIFTNGVIGFDEMDLFNRFKDRSVYEKQDNGASVLMVELTLVQAAAARGAVCLDGSVPGYHLYRGYGSGANNWIIHLQTFTIGIKLKSGIVMVHPLAVTAKTRTDFASANVVARLRLLVK
ncbi:unnamed protein product, partial [Brassica oleracea]